MVFLFWASCYFWKLVRTSGCFALRTGLGTTQWTQWDGEAPLCLRDGPGSLEGLIAELVLRREETKAHGLR